MSGYTQTLPAQAPAGISSSSSSEGRRLGSVGDVLTSLWRRLCGGTLGEQYDLLSHQDGSSTAGPASLSAGTCEGDVYRASGLAEEGRAGPGRRT